MGGKVENVVVPFGGSSGYKGVVAWATEKEVDLVIPGPEQPLVDGVESMFKKGKRCLCLPLDARPHARSRFTRRIKAYLLADHEADS